MKWSGREDSNLRPTAPKAVALARLRYAPIFKEVPILFWHCSEQVNEQSVLAAHDIPKKIKLIATGHSVLKFTCTFNVLGKCVRFKGNIKSRSVPERVMQTFLKTTSF